MTRFGFLHIAIFSLLFVAGTSSAVKAEESLTPMSMDALAAASGQGAAANSINSQVYDNTIGSMGDTGDISGININNNSGLTTVIQNTGSQVSIVSSTVVNMNFH